MGDGRRADQAVWLSLLPDELEVDGVLVERFTVDGDTSAHAAGDTVTLDGIGVLTINADGRYSFTTYPGYTGCVPLVTCTVAGPGDMAREVTLALHIVPAKDTPLAEGSASSQRQRPSNVRTSVHLR